MPICPKCHKDVDKLKFVQESCSLHPRIGECGECYDESVRLVKTRC